MSKVLEALEWLEKSKNMMIERNGDFIAFECLKVYSVCKQALLELKAVKESNPDEALKCVDILKEDGCITTLYQGKELETIRQYILKAQEQEKGFESIKEIIKNQAKVLEIIFEKDVDMIELGCAEYYYQYNKEVYEKYHNDDMLLDEKEFYTLKRWVENEHTNLCRNRNYRRY